MMSLHRIIVKVGTSSLTHENGRINLRFIDKLCAVLTDLHNTGIDVILVSSGAIGVGKNRIGLDNFSRHRPLSLSEKQAMAAVGQGILLHIYEKSFFEYGQLSAQMLLTREDVRRRSRYLTARATLLELLRLGVIPVINENDSIANDEIKIGDNDNLASLVGVLCDADLIVLLTDIDGLYTDNPKLTKDAKRIPVVKTITDEILNAAGAALSDVGTGGMKTKLEAARVATNAGIPMIIASGEDPGILYKVIAGEPVGTYFEAAHRTLHARKSWILYGSEPGGTVIVDEGACKALYSGASLLPSGIVAVEGDFGRDTVIDVSDRSGKVLGRGISHYSAREIDTVKGEKTRSLAEKYRWFIEDEVIHRDNFGLL